MAAAGAGAPGGGEEARGLDLLDRLDDLGLDTSGLAAAELAPAPGGAAGEVSEALRRTVVGLARGSVAAAGVLAGADAGGTRAAERAVRRAAATPEGSRGGRLDRAAVRLLLALEGGGAPRDPSLRLENLEALVGYVQAGSMLALAEDQAPTSEQMEVDGAGARGGGAPGENAPDAALRAAESLRGLAEALGVGLEARGEFTELLGACARSVKALPQPMEGLDEGFGKSLVQRADLPPGGEDMLRRVDNCLREEYRVRRKMLTERTLVTLQSFLMSPRLQGRPNEHTELRGILGRAQDALSAVPGVELEDVFSATPGDISRVMEKVTSGDRVLDASVKSVVIGKVPDRGGRITERRMDSMPKWSSRAPDRGGHVGGRGGGRAGGGGGGGGKRGKHGGKREGKGGDQKK